MPQIVTLHSYRGGTGKSTAVANIGLLAAASGCRVAVVDTDIQTPDIHFFFGLDHPTSCRSLADYLTGRCEIADAVGAVTPGGAGELFVVPARSRINEVNEILMRGYDVGLLREGFEELIDTFDLDIVLLDTRSGMGNETVAAIAICSSLLVITRPDHLTAEAGQTVSLARRLGNPDTSVVVNMVHDPGAGDTVRRRAEHVYGSPVIAMLPYCAELAALGSNGLFARDFPGHAIVSAYRQMVGALATGRPAVGGGGLR